MSEFNPKTLTREEILEIKAKEKRANCPRCNFDYSVSCYVLGLQIPIGKDPRGNMLAANVLSIIQPLVCPSCGLSILDKPSDIAVAAPSPIVLPS